MLGRGEEAPRRLAYVAGALLALVIVQIYLGALVAGLRAGLIYNTWPLIDGSIVPSAANLLFDKPLLTAWARRNDVRDTSGSDAAAFAHPTAQAIRSVNSQG
jgi:heme A synthase